MSQARCPFSSGLYPPTPVVDATRKSSGARPRSCAYRSTKASAGRFGQALAAGLLLSSCGPPTEKEVRDEFFEFVSTRNRCEANDDCVLVDPGCPLGCHTAVNRRYENEVKAKAKELVEEWNDGYRDCQASCPGPAVAVCSEAGRCEALVQ